MKRFLATTALLSLLSISTFAGDLPTSGGSSPAPGDLPTSGVMANESEDLSSSESDAVLSAIFTIIGLLHG